jgi:hypothetical protein
MAIKASAITKADIKIVLKKQVRDDVRQYRRELSLQRINVGKVVGVGNLDDYAREWELDFANSKISSKEPQQKNKKLRRVTKTKRNPKL